MHRCYLHDWYRSICISYQRYYLFLCGWTNVLKCSIRVRGVSLTSWSPTLMDTRSARKSACPEIKDWCIHHIWSLFVFLSITQISASYLPSDCQLRKKNASSCSRKFLWHIKKVLSLSFSGAARFATISRRYSDENCRSLCRKENAINPEYFH